MSILSRFFGKKYDDEQIMSHARSAIAVDPLVADSEAVTVTSSKGVIKLTGTVHREQEKDRIEGVIRNAISVVGLEFAQLINEVEVHKD